MTRRGKLHKAQPLSGITSTTTFKIPARSLMSECKRLWVDAKVALQSSPKVTNKKN